MDILNKKQKIIIIIIVTFMLLFVGFYIINKANNSGYIELETQENEAMEKEIENEEKFKKEKIIIHITGAVKKQGIIELKEGARISDAINAAEGTTSEVDLSKVNLAYIVEDGQKIYIPNINDKEDVESVTKEAGQNVLENNDSKTSKVNINTASQTELETLSGVGPSTALKIINYREENGDFKKIEDIKNVPGIGDAKFENLKGGICVK